MEPWKVLYTQSLYENKVAQQFDRYHIEYYLPRIELRRQWSDRVKKLMVPVFPNYIFVRVSNKNRNEVFNAKGVLHYVRVENRDACITENEIQLIRDIEHNKGMSSVSPYEFSKGDLVTIRAGLMQGMKGTICEPLGNRRVRLILKELTLEFAIEIPTNLLMPV
jgi:transcriptional antiterminator RfaH